MTSYYNNTLRGSFWSFQENAQIFTDPAGAQAVSNGTALYNVDGVAIKGGTMCAGCSKGGLATMGALHPTDSGCTALGLFCRTGNVPYSSTSVGYACTTNVKAFPWQNI